MNNDESGRPSRKSNRTQTQLYHLSKFGMFVNVLIKSFNRVWLIVNIRRVRKVQPQFNLRLKDFNCDILNQICRSLTFSSLLNLREKQIKKIKEKKIPRLLLQSPIGLQLTLLKKEPAVAIVSSPNSITVVMDAFHTSTAAGIVNSYKFMNILCSQEKENYLATPLNNAKRNLFE